MNQFYKSLALWLTIILLFMLLYSAVRNQQEQKVSLSYSRFLSYLQEGRVTQVTLQGNHLIGETASGSTFETYMPEDPELMKNLRENRVEILKTLDLPCILKQPDSSFSQGVVKVETVEDLQKWTDQLLKNPK